MDIDKLIEKNDKKTCDGFEGEELDDFTKIGMQAINELEKFCKKYNYDMDSVIEYFAELFATMSVTATFANYKGGKKND